MDHACGGCERPEISVSELHWKIGRRQLPTRIGEHQGSAPIPSLDFQKLQRASERD
jgi:hypothetical protein